MLTILPVDVDNDGWSEWRHPSRGYLAQCCGCDLIHEMEFAIVPARNAGDVACNEGEDAAHLVIFRAKRRDDLSGEQQCP